MIFFTAEDKCEYLEKILDIYEQRFAILNGVIHRHGNMLNGHSVPIGYLEMCFIYCRDNGLLEKVIGIKYPQQKESDNEG